ncbi:hypothetical protein HZ326_22679 [Fusarium oxysporum f. sp. albedinis]|nr:hypothetical protein HZ326_22679 [Fusarium oxysporum f. sp. albedinis]
MSIDPNAADLSCDTNSSNYHENRLKRLSWDNSCYMLASAGRDFEITRFAFRGIQAQTLSHACWCVGSSAW